jgi:hypothetical protein
MPPHENHTFIEQLFFQQMKRVTLADSFDVQHSDAWMV